MKKSALLALLQEKGDDDEIDDVFPKSEPQATTPPSIPPVAPVIKSDTVMTMTAAEFLKVIEKLSPQTEPAEKEEDDNAQIFIQ